MSPKYWGVGVVLLLISIMAAYEVMSQGQEVTVQDEDSVTNAEDIRGDTTVEDLVAPPKPVRFSEKSNGFLFDFYKVLSESRQQGEFFSSVSIYSALLMVLFGAGEGESRLKLLSGLHLQPSEDGRVAHLIRSRDELFGMNTNDTVCNTADKIWIDSKKELNEQLKAIAEDIFPDGFSKTSFSTHPRQAEGAINDWVSQKTNGLVKKLIAPGTITTNTNLVLTNAIYFKAKWKYPFDSEATRDRPFHLLNGEKIEIPTMARRGKVHFLHEEDFMSMIEMPYKDDTYSMVIMLPHGKSTVDSVLNAVNAEKLTNMMGKMEPWTLDIILPKFEMEVAYNLNKELSKMGLGHLFTSKSGLTKFLKDGENIILTDVVHKAKISITEEGTEAGAGTAVISGRSMVPRFAVDKPFAFFIRHTESGTILFFGKVYEPKHTA